ncbi:MAG: hypothetical protein JKY46_09510 [Robiginitomaculum sp.]|nr:hypothetical protein [Robiginitomaculum sp.]
MNISKRNIIVSLTILVSISLGACLSSARHKEQSSVLIGKNKSIIGELKNQAKYGSCTTKDKRKILFSLGDILILEHLNDVTGFKYSLKKESLFSSFDGRTNVTRLDTLICKDSDCDHDLDLDLGFVMFKEKPYIYWQETYKYQVKRHGLIIVDGFDSKVFCDGKIGVTTISN